ncbi:hypothetical protein PPL_06185 [Heterostelium album PN500]|uniref:Uncharacterized protein n=1 Tax=Heterostelium pallidum (strain ATCC 26659 / Pp 5 / PN500) TaxID=670386 RepID=D3BCG0_HETP5|nr:hypothetical protein PPL_06185 [Heterostelium album PN500]EFA80950.1 hypothetical protein PPL_06185 [Heterostelium album PN500]|eukprot:XP_020433068.1 hypothetical protein PPL_06185 [Heterostelium album PN500]
MNNNNNNNNNNIYDDDNAKQSSYSKNSWRNYLDIYDRAAAYLVDLKMPTNNQLVSYDQKQSESQSTIDSLVRVAFYSAFTTIKKKTNINNNNSNDYIQHSNNNNENIFINEAWLEYFSSVIKNRSKGSCIFRIKSYRNRLLNNSNNSNSNNNLGSSSGGLFGKLKGLSDPFLNSSSSSSGNNINNNSSNNNINKNSSNIENKGEFRNGYFVDDLEVDSGEDDDSNSSVLRYKYEKDFVLIKDGSPLIVSLSPDWGVPFHIKEQIIIAPPPPTTTSTTSTTTTTSGKHHNSKHSSKHQHNNNNNNNNDGGDSQWGCSIM